jgi:hypothetical protein
MVWVCRGQRRDDAKLPAAVLVEVLERGVEVLLPVHPVHVHRRGDELLVVDRPVPVRVGLRLFLRLPSNVGGEMYTELQVLREMTR